MCLFSQKSGAFMFPEQIWCQCYSEQRFFCVFALFCFVFLAHGAHSGTGRKYFPHLGKGNSLWKEFKDCPLGRDLPIQSVISYF